MDYKPFIEGISKLIGATGKAAEEVAGEAGRAHGPTDVERWLGESLQTPEKQVPLIHDYLRGQAALSTAEKTGATHVDGVAVPTWRGVQDLLEGQVQNDPEVQSALKKIYVERNTPPDPDVTTTLVKPRVAKVTAGPIGSPTGIPGAPVDSGPGGVATEVPDDTPTMPQAKPKRSMESLSELAKSQRADAWHNFSLATEIQNPVHIESALERIKALHAPDDLGAKPGEVPVYQKALSYMKELEAKTQEWKGTGVTTDDFARRVQQFRLNSGIDEEALPRAVRQSVDHFTSWADAQKPATAYGRFKQALGVPRALTTSFDLSAPGKQGILLMSRPEYWNNMKTMVEALNEGKFEESQAYIRNHPDFVTAHDAGLATTDVHGRMGIREEAFQSKLAEKIPGVKMSEQAYITFLNRLRFDTFTNVMRQAAAAGVDIQDKKFLTDLADWINTATGRGNIKGFNPTSLASIMFAPRLAMARIQTMNPAYYMSMHPYVRAEALKSQFASAAAIFSLVSIAGMFGAHVTWDFRNSDAGKIRVGNTRIDLGGGMFQFMRLFTQLATNERVNASTGVVETLGAKPLSMNRLDVLTRFVISKEAPIASFVTDFLRGKDMVGKPFKMSDEIASRLIPLGIQDTIDALKDGGVQALLWSAPLTTFGIGLQTYGTNLHHETVPFMGVKGEVPDDMAASYAKSIIEADKQAAVLAVQRGKNLGPVAQHTILKSYIRAERQKARTAWIKQNVGAFRAAKKAGQTTVPLVAPGNSQ